DAPLPAAPNPAPPPAAGAAAASAEAAARPTHAPACRRPVRATHASAWRRAVRAATRLRATGGVVPDCRIITMAEAEGPAHAQIETDRAGADSGHSVREIRRQMIPQKHRRSARLAVGNAAIGDQ